jgi:hypothetical protein
MNNPKRFWKWFRENSSRLSLLNQLTDLSEKEKVLNEILGQLHSYSANLYFEIGGSSNDVQELIITAEGKKENFQEVESLIAAAPPIADWKFTAFKQPADSSFVTEYEGLILDPALMWFMPLENENQPDNLGIIVYIKNYTEPHRELFISGIYKVLDTLLGEKSTSENIHYLDVAKLPANPKRKGLIELKDLSRYIKWRKESR